MFKPNRRQIVGGLAAAAGGLAAGPSFAAPVPGAVGDGHAAGYDVAPSGNPLSLIPRRAGDALTFTASLDRAPLKATSGGWAREITTRSLPIATDLAAAHLFLNPGGAREMHWHNSAEWAYILAGQCQVSVLDPDGGFEVANYAAGDLWYFPRGHPHAIQSLGTDPLNALLIFDDGLYSEHGTFGVSDWMSRIAPDLLAQSTGMRAGEMDAMPKGETYIMQGEVIALDSKQAAYLRVAPPEQSHRFRLAAATPTMSGPGGTMRVASAREFPLSQTLTGVLMALAAGAVQPPHWHTRSSEMLYVSQGRIRMTMFGADKRMAQADLVPGDVAYVPANCAHSLQNLAAGTSEVVGTLSGGSYEDVQLSDWLTRAPPHLLANNMGVDEAAVPHFTPVERLVARASRGG